MSCDKYENALRLAAASNEKPDAKLARHLEHCPACRMTLPSERDLFARIDSTLRAQVNEDPPPAFLARLRCQLSKEVTDERGSNRVRHAAEVALAVALIAAVYAIVNTGQSSVNGNLGTPATTVATISRAKNAGVTQSAHGIENSGIGVRHHEKRVEVRSVARREPEVLVPPDEQRAFAQFVACVARRDAMAEAAVTSAANKTVHSTTQLPQVSSVQMADLQFDQASHEKWIDESGSSE